MPAARNLLYKMPSMLHTQDLPKIQRELADKITAHASLDEIRILLASGAQVKSATFVFLFSNLRQLTENVNEQVVQGLRPLHYAVYGNNYDCVRLLLVRGSDVNALDEVGYSPMHLCAEHGNFMLTEYLINHNAKTCYTDPDEKDPFPRSYRSDEPLRLAIKNGHYECAQLLLEHGADPNARYFLGSEIHLLPPCETKFLKLLLMYGANPNCYDRDGLTPLMKAARHKDGIDAVKILLEFGALVNAVALERQDFRTPLHYGILSGSSKMVQYLISQGALVNMPADYGKPSPLDFAVLRDNTEIVELLLQHEANPNVAHTYIGTPLHLACCSELADQRRIIELLLKYGADCNITPRFEEGFLKSPLIEYFRSRNEFDIQVLKLFLVYGARIVMQSPLNNPNGMLRSLVKIHDNDEIFDLLLEAGQDYNVQSVERVPLPIRRRMQLLDVASQPPTLLHLSRLAVRNCLQPMNEDKPLQLPIPKMLIKYLLYQ